MNIHKYISKEDGVDLFSSGYDAALMSLNLERAESMMDEAFNFYSGAYINMLDDAEHDFSQTVRLKAKVALEEIAKKHNITYEELKDLIKYNSEGVVGAIVSAIINFFKAIIDFIVSLFKGKSSGGSGGTKYTEDVANNKVDIEETLEEANNVIVKIEQKETDNLPEVKEEENHDTPYKKWLMRRADIEVRIKKLYRIIFKLIDRNSAATRYLTALTFMDDVYDIDVLKEQYIDYPINADTYKHIIDIKKNIGLPMPSYSNSKQWLNIIRYYAKDFNVEEYPNNEVVCISLTLSEGMDDIDDNVSVILLVFSSDCEQVKKASIVRCDKIGSISEYIGAKELVSFYTKLLIKQSRYITKHKKDIRNIPDLKKLLKDVKEMYNTFKKHSKEDVQSVMEERFRLSGCEGDAPDFYNAVLKILKNSKGAVYQNYNIQEAMEKLETLNRFIIELDKSLRERKKIMEEQP